MAVPDGTSGAGECGGSGWTDGAEVLLRLTVRCDATAPGRARSAVAAVAGLERMREDLVLIASELVTNAVLHSGGLDTETLSVVVARRDHLVIMVVTDPGRSGATAGVGRRRPLGGNGLRLVGHLAARWGAERGSGHRVWVELPLR